MMRKSLLVLLAVLLLIGTMTGCVPDKGNAAENNDNTIMFTDSCGRQVAVPEDITRIAPSGTVATMILATIAPEYLVCVSNSPSSSQYKYLPKELIKLPTTGQLYGSKSTINLEALLSAKPQLIIDLGDPKDGIAADMDSLQKQTGTPTIYIQADLDHMASAYRTLGSILSGKKERGEQLAGFIDGTISMAQKNASKIDIKHRVSVMYTSGTSGLNTNARGSIQSQVLDLIGADNAIIVNDISDKGGGNTVSMEQLYLFDPDVILFTAGSVYSSAGDEPTWKKLSAIRNGTYYEIPGLPYNWMSNPPSLNMILGTWWLGNLLYPDIYSYDMKEVAKEFYHLFWNYDLTDEEAASMLANSTNKRIERGGSE